MKLFISSLIIFLVISGIHSSYASNKCENKLYKFVYNSFAKENGLEVAVYLDPDVYDDRVVHSYYLTSPSNEMMGVVIIYTPIEKDTEVLGECFPLKTFFSPWNKVKTDTIWGSVYKNYK